MISSVIRIALQIPEMGGIYCKFAGEGTAQRFISSNQRAQALVNLPVFSLAALLNLVHREQSDPDSDEGNHAKPEQSRKQRLPRSEV